MENFEKCYYRAMETNKEIKESNLEDLMGYEVVKKHQNCKRGFGSMTAALYKDSQNNWDYIEVIYPTNSDYQRDCQALTP